MNLKEEGQRERVGGQSFDMQGFFRFINNTNPPSFQHYKQRLRPLMCKEAN